MKIKLSALLPVNFPTLISCNFMQLHVTSCSFMLLHVTYVVLFVHTVILGLLCLHPQMFTLGLSENLRLNP